MHTAKTIPLNCGYKMPICIHNF